jgi:hypothetical protein
MAKTFSFARNFDEKLEEKAEHTSYVSSFLLIFRQNSAKNGRLPLEASSYLPLQLKWRNT